MTFRALGCTVVIVTIWGLPVAARAQPQQTVGSLPAPPAAPPAELRSNSRLGAPKASEPVRNIEVQTWLDRTAAWVGDRVTYVIEITCRPGVDLLADDLSQDKLKVEGLELTGSEASRRGGRDGTVIHSFRYHLAIYRVDVPTPTIRPLTVRYYVKRVGQRPQDAAPAGEMQVPAAVIAFRSMLPDDQEHYDIRDRRPPVDRPIAFMLAQPVGIGLLVASIVPATSWGVALVRRRRHRHIRRSARQVRHDQRASLEAVRQIDIATAEGRREAYTRINALVRDHLRDVCGIPAPSLTPTEIEQALSAHGLFPAEIATSLLTACAIARYAPSDALPPVEACREALDQAAQLLAVR